MTSPRPSTPAKGTIYILDLPTIEQFRRDPDELETFLQRQERILRDLYRRGVSPSQLAATLESLRRPLQHLFRPSVALGSLYVLEADTRLSLGTVEQANLAFDLSEMAISCLTALDLPSIEAELLMGEAALIAAVSLKALGLRQESSEYMREQLHSLHLNATSGITLIRQSVMMTEELAPHIRLLNGASMYRSSLPKEYYRTLKRVFEALIRDGRFGMADSLFAELVWAYGQAHRDLSASAKVSFARNLAQYAVTRGEIELAKRIVRAALLVSSAYGFQGAQDQAVALLAQIERGEPLRLTTFLVR